MFYTNTLPFELVSISEASGREQDALLGLSDVKLRVAMLKLGDERITLTEHLVNKGRPNSGRFTKLRPLVFSISPSSCATWTRLTSSCAAQGEARFNRTTNAPCVEQGRGGHQGVLLPRPGESCARSHFLSAGQGRSEVAADRHEHVSWHDHTAIGGFGHGQEPGVLSRPARPARDR